MNKRKYMHLALTLTLVAMLTACPKPKNAAEADQLRTVAESSDRAASAVRSAINVKRSLARQGVLEPDAELVVTRILLDINTTNRELRRLGKSLTVVTAADKSALVKLADDLLASVGRLNSEGVLRIKNEEAREKFAVSVEAIRAAVVIIRSTLLAVEVK